MSKRIYLAPLGATSITVGGTTYEVDSKGRIAVKDESVHGDLLSHGYRDADEAAEAEALAVASGAATNYSADDLAAQKAALEAHAADLDDLTAKLNARAAELSEREAAVAERTADLTARANALAERETDVAVRLHAVETREAALAALTPPPPPPGDAPAAKRGK